MLLTEPTLVIALATTSPPGARPSCENTSSGPAPEGLAPRSEGVVNAGVEGWAAALAWPAVTGEFGDARNSSDVDGTLWTCGGGVGPQAGGTGVPERCAGVLGGGLTGPTVGTRTAPATAAMRPIG